MNKLFKILLPIIIIFAGVFIWQLIKQNPAPFPSLPNNSDKIKEPMIIEADTPDFAVPIDRFKERLSKKSFGQYITPENSPVNPEKFIGYHTGIDLEILKGEENKDVMIKAICAGELIEKRRATGYGGVAVQKCLFNGQLITVIYGHLNLSSINHQMGDLMTISGNLGLLGQGYSTETDNERKHLHLGIHKGSEINIKGYVSAKNELKDWLDPEALLK